MNVYKAYAGRWMSVILLFLGVLLGFEIKLQSNKGKLETTRRAMAFEKRRGEEMVSAMKEGDIARYDLWQFKKMVLGSDADNAVPAWHLCMWICLMGVGGVAMIFTRGWRLMLSSVLLCVNCFFLLLPR